MRRKLSHAGLDGFDRKILRCVQENNLRPQREIADAVGLSAPAVARRLQRLRALGVIERDVSTVDRAALGRPLTLIVEIYVESELSRELDAIKARLTACSQVQQCYYVTGEADFIVIMNVRDMGEYERLTRTLFLDGGNVSRFRTFVSMENVKNDTTIVVDEPG